MERLAQDASALAIDQVPLATRHRCALNLAANDEAPATEIPVHIIVGSKRLPRLALIAGVHGDEYDGILALHEIARDWAPRDLMGTVIVVPVANPFAFAAAQRRTPQDDKDLNRVFPGTSNGSLSERLAHLLAAGLLLQTDLVFSLHGSASPGRLAPWLEFFDRPDQVGTASYAAALASGFLDLIALPALPGTLQTAMGELGVPVIEGEVGGRGAARRENVEYYKGRALAVARHLGILGNAETAAPTGHRVWHLHSIETDATGIFLREVELGAPVHAGDLLARVADIHGRVVATVRAPADGVIGYHRVHAGVRPGDRLFTLWVSAVPRVSRPADLRAPNPTEATPQ